MTAGDIDRAKGYPYDIGRRPFLFRDGGVGPIDGAPGTDRVPVVAVGSNRAPAQLARKFADWPAGTEIPVTVAWIADHDVVYSSHFTRYGALPARLAPAPGVAVEVGITWLTAPQLKRMHETEGPENYHYRERSDLAVDDTVAGRLATVGLYDGRRPPLTLGERPIALAAVAARGRTGPALMEEDALAHARDLLAPDAPLEDFIRSVIEDPAVRATMTERLARASSPAPAVDQAAIGQSSSR